MNNYYTYAYLREDGTPYYIGKGRGVRAYKNHGRCCARPPKDRILILKNNLTENEAYKHEIYMIKHYGKKIDGGILHNINDGGEITPNHKGKKCWTNSIKNKVSYKCPGEGWYLGRVGNFKNPPRQNKMLWWNDGNKHKKSKDCPGEGWTAGMITKKVYELYSPDGKTYQTSNISIFCKDNNISAPHLISVCNGERKSTCGWRGKVL